MKKVTKEIENSGGRIDAFYYCPHKSEDNCECRKPKPALILQAIKENNISVGESWFIGDKTSDIKAGKDAGCKTILVKTGYAGEDKRFDIKADYNFNNLFEAIKFIKS